MLKKCAHTVIDTILTAFNRRLVKENGAYRLERNIFFDEFAIYRSHYKADKKLVIFDVGAHVGDTVQEMLSAYPGAQIHAFEPASDNFKSLQNRYQNNTQVTVNNVAVGAEKSSAELFVLGEKVTGNSLVTPSNKDLVKKTETIPVVALDDYCAEHKIEHIDILKIDTQGYERECLNGLKDMLQSGAIGLIKLEVMFHESYARTTSFRLLEEILHPYGYYLIDICWIKKSSHKSRTLVADVIYGQIHEQGKNAEPIAANG